MGITPRCVALLQIEHRERRCTSHRKRHKESREIRSKRSRTAGDGGARVGLALTRNRERRRVEEPVVFFLDSCLIIALHACHVWRRLLWKKTRQVYGYG